MAHVVSHELSAKLPTDSDVKGINFYIDGAADPDFIGKASVGQWPAADTRFVDAASADATGHVVTVFGAGDLVEGTYSFAAAAVDTTGNLSDAVTKPEWTNVPLDLTAPGVPTDLSIRSF